MSPLPLHQDLNAYSAWTVQVWTSTPSELGERDFTIMSLGVGGEAGEVLDVVMDSWKRGELDVAAATKEMGDVFYYWSRLAQAFGIDALSTLGLIGSPDFAVMPLDVVAAKVGVSEGFDSTRCALVLAARISRLQELLKKRVRDGHFPEDEFAAALGRAGRAWLRTAQAMGLTPSSILQMNVEKINSRRARGVLRGSGDDR